MKKPDPHDTKSTKATQEPTASRSVDYIAETAALVRSKATACRYGGGNAKVCRKLEALADVIDPLFEAPPPLGDGSPEPAPAPAKDGAKAAKSKKLAPKKSDKEVDEEPGGDLDLERDDEAE